MGGKFFRLLISGDVNHTKTALRFVPILKLSFDKALGLISLWDVECLSSHPKLFEDFFAAVFETETSSRNARFDLGFD